MASSKKESYCDTGKGKIQKTMRHFFRFLDLNKKMVDTFNLDK